MERAKEALSTIKDMDSRKYKGKFINAKLHSIVSFKLSEQQNKCPLLLNQQNVLYRLTSRSRESILSVPFKNLSRELFLLCRSLGSDIYEISRNVKKLSDDEKRKEEEKRKKDISESFSITTNSRSKGVQTDLYECNDCRKRSLRSFTSIGVGCKMVQHTADVACSTTKNTGGLYAEVPTMHGLTSEQLQCIRDFKRLFNCQDSMGEYHILDFTSFYPQFFFQLIKY